jgi:hypothetical protein
MSNSGVFDVNDIRYLMDYQQWPTPGELQLIQTQTASDVATVDFTDIQENIYNVHLLTVNNLQVNSAGTNARTVVTRLSNDGGSSFISGSTAYERAYRGYYSSVGAGSDVKSTGISYMNITGAQTSLSAASNANCYIYLYNLGDNTKYSFSTIHSSGWMKQGYGIFHFGMAIYPVAEIINGIRLLESTGTDNINSGTFSLYGIRFS